MIYDVAFEERGATLWAREGRVNRLPDQYGGTDDEHDRRMIVFIIETLVLGLPAQFPVQDRLAPDQQAIAQSSVAGEAAFE